MKLGYISAEQLSSFSSLLLPDAIQAIKAGEPVTALGIVKDKVACGAIAGYIENYYFNIISLYVAPDYRRQGTGKVLLDGLRKFLGKCSSIHEIRINYTVTSPEHEALAPFLAAMHFSEMDDEGITLYKFPLSLIAGSSLLSASTTESSSILCFKQIPDYMLAFAEKTASIQNVPLPELSLTSPELNRELSYAIVRNEKVQAFVAFDHSCASMPTLACAWTGEAGPTALPVLLRKSFQKALELYPKETIFAVQAVTPTASALVQTLIPDAARFSFTYYANV